MKIKISINIKNIILYIIYKLIFYFLKYTYLVLLLKYIFYNFIIYLKLKIFIASISNFLLANNNKIKKKFKFSNIILNNLIIN